MNERIGELVGGRYRILDALATGAQGTVYRVRDERDGELLAAKIMHRASRHDPAARERMHRELQALVSLWGKGVVRVVDQAFASDECFCLIMELLQGEDLGTYLDRIEATGQRASVATVLEVFGPLVATIEETHRLGIIHRDLKPSNIFLVDRSAGGGVRVLDFGFAKFVRMRGLTAQGMVTGTPSYIAPEVWLGETTTSSIDVYALGALVFRTLAGRPPFEGPLTQLIRIVPTAPRPSLWALRPDLSPDIDAWILQALAIRREERFLTPRALWNALRLVLGDRRRESR